MIVGAGGFGRGVNDVVDAINAVEPTWEILGYVDDDPDSYSTECAERRNVKILGDVSTLESLPTDARAVIGIADSTFRATVDRYLAGLGIESATVVHPDATVAASAVLGAGTVVCAGVRIASNVRLGRHVHMNLNATAGHDARLGDYVNVFPQAALSGFSVVHTGATLGSHAVVLPSVTVGESATIGAGAVVVRDIDGGRRAKGLPAR